MVRCGAATALAQAQIGRLRRESWARTSKRGWSLAFDERPHRRLIGARRKASLAPRQGMSAREMIDALVPPVPSMSTDVMHATSR